MQRIKKKKRVWVAPFLYSELVFNFLFTVQSFVDTRHRTWKNLGIALAKPATKSWALVKFLMSIVRRRL